jgi:hypothetical protein
MRSYDATLIQTLVGPYLKDEYFSFKEWLSCSKSIALIDSNNNVALFEPIEGHRYQGHYYFAERGRGALDAGKRFLEELFTQYSHIQVLQGLTPVDQKGARWLSRQLGFKSYGVADTIAGPTELFILTRAEYFNNKESLLDG